MVPSGIRFPARLCACAFCGIAIVATTGWSATQQMQQNYEQFEIDRGATLYSSNCIECHTDGTGAAGTNFRTGEYPHGSRDEDLINAIQDGVPGTAMPPHNFSGADLAALLAYLRSLSEENSGAVKLGDPAKGKQLFENEGKCLDCHRVGVNGSHRALNLSEEGSQHPPTYILRALIDPDSMLTTAPEHHLVRAVTKSGKIINGRRLNEDTYSIQLMDDHENLISLQKDDLKSLTVALESPMPSAAGKFTDEQIADLVAYLVSLKSKSAVPPSQFGSVPGRGGGGRAPVPAAATPPTAGTGR